MEYTMNEEYICSQCKKYTDLTEEEIMCIVNMARQLPHFAAINDTEAFVDVKVHNEDKALIVAEFFREESIYKHSFLGEPAFRCNEPAVFRALDLGMKTSDIACVSYDTFNGESILSKQTAIPIRGKDRVIGVLTLEKNMEPNIITPTEVGKSTKLNLAKYENDEMIAEILGFQNDHSEGRIKEGILVFDEKGNLIRVNGTAKKIYEQLGFKEISNLHFDNINLSSLTFSAAKRMEKQFEEKIQIDRSFYSISVMVEKKQNLNIVVFIEDITRYKELEKKIEKYLVSYQEIHHRIKNNLQTIASLLQIQARKCAEDQKTVYILSESVNRILSISVAHDLLSKNSGDEVSIMEVIGKLRENIVSFGLSERDNISIEIMGSDFLASSDQATTIALITNELIQNSLKHAYDKERGGRILIKIGLDEGFKMVEVKDFGKGYDTSEGRKGSLGLQIVESYVYEKLNGRLSVNTGKSGTSTVFVFK